MKLYFTQITYIILFCFFSNGILAQEYSLKVTSKENQEKIILNKIEYEEKHIDSISLYNEVNKVRSYLKKSGYFTNVLDSIKKTDKRYTAYLTLNKKTRLAVIRILKNSFEFKHIETKNNSFTIPIEKLEQTLLEITNELDALGNSFSKIQLKKIKLKNGKLFADLEINQSKKRVINKVLFKGYEKFPKSFIKNYFDINAKTIFNKKKMKEISNLSKGLQFASEIKPPEVLFTKDSTFLYMYLKKNNRNSFDGLVNFTSSESGAIQFNGYLDLKLKNVLNKGENFQVLWNRNGDERQEFLIGIEIPYTFNSKVSPELGFSIYKQDSTFLNTKFDSKLNYKINKVSNLSLTYSSEDSEKLTNSGGVDIEKFDNNFIGVAYQIRILNNDFFNNDKFLLHISPSIGKRKNDTNSQNQIKITSTGSYLLNISKRNFLFLKNQIGILSSANYIQNELFRIGGNTTIRGFDQQNIFTKNYLIQNIEYRYLTSEKSYLYSITDLALITSNNVTKKLVGLGFGYLFSTRNSQINLSYTIGGELNGAINTQNGQFYINWVNFF